MSMSESSLRQIQMDKAKTTKKMGDFIEPGTHRSTVIKVKIETLLKKSDFFTFHFSFELDMPFLIDLKNNIFVVILK